MAEPHILIAIPTFRRPQSLARLLDAIARLETAGMRLSVLVADNDAEAHAGFDLAQARAATFPFVLRAVIAEQRGIAQVRNRMIAEALKTDAQFVAMIDDDEWPEPQWLAAFLRMARITGAGALQGSILFGHPAQADIVRASGPTGMLQGAGNLLLRRAVLEAMVQPWFDPDFALTGGEDREFFVRLSRAGVTFAWADEARCHGEVPDSRASLSWMLQRAYSIGNSDMRVLLKHGLGAGRTLAEIGKILAVLLLAPPAALLLLPSARHRTAALEKFCRAAGKLGALTGRRYEEYATVHGG